MSFPVDYTTTIDGVTIKCSKTFDQLGTITAEDLREYAIAGIYDIGVCRAGMSCETLGNSDKVKANTPVEYVGASWDDVRVNFNDGTYNPAITAPHYGFTILVYGLEGQNVRSTTSNSRLVLDVPVQSIYANMPALTTSTITKQNDADLSDEASITVYDTDSSGVIKTIANDNNTQIHAMNVFVYDDTNFFIFPASYTGGFSFIHTTYIWGGNFSSASGSLSGTHSIQPYYATTYDSQTAIYANMCDTSNQAGMSLTSFDWTKAIVAIFDTPEPEKEQSGAYMVLTYTGMYGYPQFVGYLTFYAKSERQCYLGFANTALKFKANNTMYKPVIENGVVIDYTDDMDDPSEFDDIETVTGNNVPITPPSPPTPEDEDDYADMGIGTGGNVGGLTSYAIMSISDLADLIADFNTGLQTGQSVVNNFVCCYKLGPLSSFLCTTGAHNIIMSAYSTTGNNFVSTRADYAVISSQKSSVLLGTITVPRKTNTFYDFAPYSTYELFIPCCGWVPLPDSVAGRDIQVYLVFDLASCVCKGIVRSSGAADGTTIAEISGVIGSSVPFYVNDSGLARASLVTGVTQTLSNIAMGAVGAASGNTGLAVMGLGNAVQSAQQTAISGNTNYTAVRGGNGDMSAYANGEYCTIKITHPVIDKVVETSMFGHSVGYLCEEVGQLSNFHGFTVCANPHVHINATSAERDEITQLLEQGVILP